MRRARGREADRTENGASSVGENTRSGGCLPPSSSLYWVVSSCNSESRSSGSGLPVAAAWSVSAPVVHTQRRRQDERTAIAPVPAVSVAAIDSGLESGGQRVPTLSIADSSA